MSALGSVTVPCPVCSVPLEIPATVSMGSVDYDKNEVALSVQGDPTAANEHVAAHATDEAGEQR
ncbi:hypothetical protein R1Y80_09830 [Streptomyces sp. JL1001]|uniref:Uncharacterized protein n=1 Tax=Streptomyces sp. JL1001 TaxID=3078227 RepID=A0AAU8KC47_9ACTN